jgi:hypothetical protein
VHALSGKSKAQVLLGDLSGAAQTLDLCGEIVKKLGARRIPPFQLSNYQRCRFLLDVAEFEAARDSGDEARARAARRRGGSSGPAALRLANKCVLRKSEVLRLLGRYHWLAGNEKQAWRWWRRNLAEGRRLGARPETARACLEVARHLGKRGRSDASFDGRAVEDYLKEARATFEELGLRWDLQQLEALGSAAP